MAQTQTSVSNTESVEANDDAGLSQTTRIFVSGLPPKFTSHQLESHFGTRHQATDAHVIADRRIGFVGFRDTKSAHDAAKHFNRTYIRMSKIVVDLAKPVTTERNAADTVSAVARNRNNVRHDGSHKKRKRSQDDDGETERDEQSSKKTDNNVTVAVREGQEVPHESTGTEEETPSNVPTDIDWIRGRTTRTLDLIAPEDVDIRQDEDTIDAKSPKADPQEAPDAAVEAAAAKPNYKDVPNGRLFLRNLAFSCTNDDLRKRFESYGKLQEVHVVKDARTSTSKGTAFLQFAETQAAESALHECDGTTFQGRLLHILPATDKRDKGLTEFEISQMPLKKQKAIRRKLDAATHTFSWNSLYMNPDAVLASVADRLGVSKSDILDPTSADAAVKQAHAETQLIKETKDYLESAGVDISAFKHKGRDDRCVLLKNFPYGTSEAELRALLEPHGAISMFLLPPAGTMAFAQYAEAFSASQALKALAYKSLKGSVLYIEKAPQGILNAKPSEQQKADTVPEQSSTDGTSTTVFVKNLNFSTPTSRLQEIVSTLPGFVSARVKTRVDPKKPGQVLSMGFGFVEFRSKQQAEAAVKALSGHSVDGHNLVVQLSSKTIDAAENTRKQDLQRRKEANQTKIIIKNLPFQVSKKDIRALFAQYGELKKVRVPRKFDNSTRGFAFAEFVTPKEAENAMEALKSTHLLGRRLVLEFAASDDVDPEEEIRAIEKKVEQQSKRVHINSLKGPGRRKFALDAREDDIQ